MRKFTAAHGLAAGLVILAVGTSSAFAVSFVDPTKANVMRQYDAFGNFLAPTAVSNLAGNFSWVWNSPVWNGNGEAIGGSNLNTSSDQAMQTITLPNPQPVGGYSVQFGVSYDNRHPSNFLLEGYNTTDGWFTLKNLTGITTQIVSGTTDVNKTVTQVRYTASGPTGAGAGQYNYTLGEIQLRAPSTATIPLYGGGFSYIRDTGVVATTYSSPTTPTGPWAAPNGGTPWELIDGDVVDANVKCQLTGEGNATLGQRGYVIFQFSSAYRMDFAALAGNNDQTWANNWEAYTTNALNLSSLNGLSSATPAAIQGAGWTLQYSQADATPKTSAFNFSSPGQYQYLMLVWDAQHNATAELELFALIPEPASLSLLALGGLAMLRRRRR